MAAPLFVRDNKFRPVQRPGLAGLIRCHGRQDGDNKNSPVVNIAETEYVLQMLLLIA